MYLPNAPGRNTSLYHSSQSTSRTPYIGQSQTSALRARASSMATRGASPPARLPALGRSQHSPVRGGAPAAAAQNASPTGRTLSLGVSQHTGRFVTAAELRVFEERLARLEEKESQSQSLSQTDVGSQSSGFAASERQRNDLTLLTRNASGGPSAPPEAKHHAAAKIHRHFRRLVYLGYGGVKGGKELARQSYPGRGPWPKHPPSQGERDPSNSQNQDADEELTHGNQIRFDFVRTYTDKVNQNQLRKTFRYMLAHRTQCGVPADMTGEELVSQCASTFKGWAREHTRSLTSAGRNKRVVASLRACLAARRKRKAGSRGKALRLHRYLFFADGSKVAKPRKPEDVARIRRGAVRADVEFAIQDLAMSDEEDDWETYPTTVAWSDDEGSVSDGGRPGRSVRRRVGIPWRSAGLIAQFALLDKKRARQPSKPIVPAKRLRVLPPNFTLPSSVRRWMVAQSWAEANEESCVDVSDNAGPFQGRYSVVKGAKDWGEDPNWHDVDPEDSINGDGEPRDGDSNDGDGLTDGSQRNYGLSDDDDEDEDDSDDSDDDDDESDEDELEIGSGGG